MWFLVKNKSKNFYNTFLETISSRDTGRRQLATHIISHVSLSWDQSHWGVYSSKWTAGLSLDRKVKEYAPLEYCDMFLTLGARNCWLSYRWTQIGPRAHPASYTMCIWAFPGVKLPGRGADHPPPSSAKVKERVELHLYSPSGPSWPDEIF